MIIKILIVDDHELIRDSLKRMLELEEGFEVAGTCENGKIALEYLQNHQVDLVLMDAVMPVMGGVECTRRLRSFNKQVKVLILTTFSDQKLIHDAFNARIDGYILKDIKAPTLVNNIKDCMNGEIIIPNKIAQKLARAIANTNYVTFNQTEQEVIELLVGGFSNKQIASELNISYGTVRNYISEIYKKVGENNRQKVITILQKTSKHTRDSH